VGWEAYAKELTGIVSIKQENVLKSYYRANIPKRNDDDIISWNDR
jgi:hypothetical protein